MAERHPQRGSPLVSMLSEDRQARGPMQPRTQALVRPHLAVVTPAAHSALAQENNNNTHAKAQPWLLTGLSM